MIDVSALYVEKDGIYTDAVSDIWDISRDARNYNGQFPVVAHPPCQLWGNLAEVNFARWGGEHNRPGNDGGCFDAALIAVRKNSGVLEHPANTKAWRKYQLLTPIKFGWQEYKSEWTCEVWQSAYGHRANKATWLFYCGNKPPFQLNWSRPIGTHQVGFQDKRGKSRNKPSLSKRESNATPIKFRDELIRLSLWSRS